MKTSRTNRPVPAAPGRPAPSPPAAAAAPAAAPPPAGRPLAPRPARPAAGPPPPPSAERRRGLGPRRPGERGRWRPGAGSRGVCSLTSILSSFLWRCSSFTRCSIRATRVRASSCCPRSRCAAPRTPSLDGVGVGGVAGICAGGGASPWDRRGRGLAERPPPCSP